MSNMICKYIICIKLLLINKRVFVIYYNIWAVTFHTMNHPWPYALDLQAFTMIDQNQDGVIDLKDLKDIHSNLGELYS